MLLIGCGNVLGGELRTHMLQTFFNIRHSLSKGKVYIKFMIYTFIRLYPMNDLHETRESP